MQEVKVKVPRCWQDLIQKDFVQAKPWDICVQEESGDLIPIESGPADNGNPDPHYDDYREVGFSFPNGATGVLSLCSGQSNYYGECEIFQGETCVYSSEGESWENLGDDWDEVTGEDGETYRINYEYED